MITRTQYEAGKIIIQENESGETAYVIEEGKVEVTKALDGQSVHLAYLGAGEIFGEMSMIDEKPRSATVTAVTDTVGHGDPARQFFQQLSSRSQSGALFVEGSL